MANRLFPRLAAQGMRASRQFYYPYLLTLGCTAAGFYNICAISYDEGIAAMPHAAYVSMFCTLGTFLVGVFAVVFIFYTNSFLMKRRTKELALYNVLGMGKRHIAKILLWETFFTGLIGLCGGLVAGILLHKLLTLALFRLLRLSVPFGFSVSRVGIVTTVVLFGAILLLTLLHNLRQISVANPVALLRSGQTGEREPKTRWLLTLVGIAALGGGYGLALWVNDPVGAVVYYFLAVYLVVIGTYCLFTAVSITVLKLLRKNKRFYYKTSHFISVSGMLYRMKQNAVGLSNICILSTMVLVMLSGTLALYLGTQDVTDLECPADIVTQCMYWNNPDSASENGPDAQAIQERLTEALEAQGLEVTQAEHNCFVAFTGIGGNGVYECADESARGRYYGMVFITAQDYAALTGEEVPVLEKGQAMAYGLKDKEDTVTVLWDGEPLLTLEITAHLEDFPAISGDSNSAIGAPVRLVVRDYETLQELFGEWTFYYEFRFMTNGTDTQNQDACYAINSGEVNLENTGEWEMLENLRSYGYTRDENFGLAGGFLFLGIFLGILFMMAAVLILYYKQISEGYADRERYQIMQKVGLTRQEIKRSVNGQILTVFFLPLVVTCIHLLFNFRLMVQLLQLFRVYNYALVAACSVGTILVFAILYALVYSWTARAYYKLVS